MLLGVGLILLSPFVRIIVVNSPMVSDLSSHKYLAS